MVTSDKYKAKFAEFNTYKNVCCKVDNIIFG
jgi:hypothetical protein